MTKLAASVPVKLRVLVPRASSVTAMSATLTLLAVLALVMPPVAAAALLAAVGFLRLGTFIKFIPFPVTVGFTAGIAVIIFASQIKDLLGREMLDQRFAGMKQALENATDEDRQAVNEMLDDLNGGWRQERFAFYEAAKEAYAVIQTGERRFYGCFMFRKGVIPPEE